MKELKSSLINDTAIDIDYSRKIVSYLENNQTIEISYLEFFDDVKKFTEYLKLKEVVQKRVGIVGKNSYEWIVTFLSLIYLGNKIIPLDSANAGREFIELSNEMDVLLLERGMIEEVEIIPLIRDAYFFFDDFFEEMQLFNEVIGQITLNKSNEAESSIIVFTSGTTGKRKGVELSLMNIISCAKGMTKALELGSEWRPIIFSPFHHALGISLIISTLLNNGTLVISKNKFKPEKEIELFQPTFFPLVPMLLELYLTKYRRNKEFFGTKIKVINCGSAPTKRKVIEQYLDAGLNLCLSYGLSEAAPFLTSVRSSDSNEKKFTVGKPINGVQLKVLEGEICAKGDNIFSGYIDSSNHDTFTEDGWFKTGDIGTIDEENYLLITGRKKNMIPLENGKNIYPEQIEERIYNLEKQIQEIIVYSEDNCYLIAEIYAPKLNSKELEQVIKKYNKNEVLHENILETRIREKPFEKKTLDKIARQ